MLGTLLDQRYKVTALLGAGGFGQTYIAEDTRRPGNPQCVVKHLQPASADTQFLDVARRLFRTEAEMLEKLGRHDQIPQLLAYFEDQREFYLVQEFIQGQPLTDEIPMGQPLPEVQVVSIVQEILNVLHFVHYHQVIHRDIKPDNLIRRQSDHHLVLIDFGAVKEIRTQIADVGQSVGYTVGIGTQGYMPGEQLSGRPRLNSDIYAVGMIGIKALTGIEPIQLPVNEQTAELQWRSLAPQVTPAFAEVLERMVRSQFNIRYQAVTDVLQDLQALSRMTDSTPVPPTDLVLPVRAATSPSPNLAATDIVSLKLDPPKPHRTAWWIAAGMISICGLGGTLAYTLGLMPNLTDLNQQTTDASPSRSSSEEPASVSASAPLSTPDIIPLPANCQVTVNDPNPPLNVRSSPETAPNNIVTTVDNGVQLSVLGSQAGWLKIKAPASGWVSENLTQRVCQQPAQRVQFSPGETGTVLAQTLNPHDLQPFLLNARAQQTMTVQLSTGSVEVRVLDPQDQLITQVDRQTPSAQAILPRKGDYTITVENPQKSSERFSLEVDVMSPAPAPADTTSRIQFAPGATGTQLNNTIQLQQRQRYLLNAGSQQILRMNIPQGDIQLSLLTPSGQPLAQLNQQSPDWQGQLPSTGDYVLNISALQAGPYVINIDIK